MSTISTTRRRLIQAMAACAAAPALAQVDTPIRFILPVATASGVDTITRAAQPALAKAFGRPVVVENQPGAGGIVGLQQLARAAPDGRTLSVVSNNVVIFPSVLKSVPFDMPGDFTPIAVVGYTPVVLVVNPGVPAKNAKELIALLKAKGDDMNYASSGNGTILHLACAQFLDEAGVKARHIPYKGVGPMVTDLIGGQVQFGFDAVAIGLPHVKSGRLRALATTGRTRLSFLPDVPSAAETLPKFEVVNWYGMVVPVGTPRDIIARLHAEIVKAMNIPEIHEKLVAQGTDPVGSTPEEFGAFMKAETAKWARVIKAANIKAD